MRNGLKNGRMNRVSGNQTTATREYNFLEKLCSRAKIKNYTYDGWIQIGTEWVPTEFGLKKIGVYDEYLEYRG